MPRLFYLFISILVLSGCQLEYGLPDGLVVNCSQDEPCSAGLICSEQHQVCVDKEPICGNGKVEFPELCDDSFLDDCGSCNAGCNGAGTASVCGDKQVCPEFETCDDGHEDSCGSCNNNCTGPGDGSACGDGLVCPEQEYCDDGFKTECGSCNADCTGPGEGSICGDGFQCEETESCDDGNTETETCGYGNINCLFCDAECKLITLEGTYCGDGVVQPDEVCDPEASERNCGDISNEFLNNSSVGCQSDCSAWDVTQCWPDTDDEEKMVSIPAGPFLRGCNTALDGDCFSDEYPYRQLRLSAYRMDTHEVTTGEYRACVQAGGCLDTNLNYDQTSCNYAQTGREDHPINCVDYDQAQAYCLWSGKHLPTEAQWEKAARGSDGRIYPWGNTPLPSCTHTVMNNGTLSGCGEGRTSLVGSRPLGISPYGVLDMTGNVYEWTNDWWSDTYYGIAPENDPQGPSNDDGVLIYRVLRGGSWSNINTAKLRASSRFVNSPTARSLNLGFRCAHP